MKPETERRGPRCRQQGKTLREAPWGDGHTGCRAKGSQRPTSPKGERSPRSLQRTESSGILGAHGSGGPGAQGEPPRVSRGALGSQVPNGRFRAGAPVLPPPDTLHTSKGIGLSASGLSAPPAKPKYLA